MSDPLAESFELPCGTVLPNRIFKSALSEGIANADNSPDEGLFRLYRQWSEGGNGSTLLTGNVMVHRHHLDKPGNVVIDGKEDKHALEQWAKAGTTGGNEIWMQINHTGRQTGTWCNSTPLAPSAVPLDLGAYFGEPVEMTGGQIEETIERLGYAARVAKETGFGGVQLHGAHGYLASQFLSPRMNQREDDWGGPLENRARFLLEALRAIRAVVGSEFPVGVKLNSADFQKGGFTNEECLQVVQWLNAESLDLLEVSGGTFETMSMTGADRTKKASTIAREAYFLEYAEQIRKVATMPLLVTGGFRSRIGMEEALASGATDFIGVGRPFCADPSVVGKLLSAEIDTAGYYEPYLFAQLEKLPPREGKTKPRFEPGNFWYNFQMQAIARGEDPGPFFPAIDARALDARHVDLWTSRWQAVNQ